MCQKPTNVPGWDDRLHLWLTIPEEAGLSPIFQEEFEFERLCLH